MLRVLVMTATMMLMLMQPTFAFGIFKCQMKEEVTTYCDPEGCETKVNQTDYTESHWVLLITRGSEDNNWFVEVKAVANDGNTRNAVRFKHFSGTHFISDTDNYDLSFLNVMGIFDRDGFIASDSGLISIVRNVNTDILGAFLRCEAVEY